MKEEESLKATLTSGTAREGKEINEDSSVIERKSIDERNGKGSLDDNEENDSSEHCDHDYFRKSETPEENTLKTEEPRSGESEEFIDAAIPSYNPPELRGFSRGETMVAVPDTENHTAAKRCFAEHDYFAVSSPPKLNTLPSFSNEAEQKTTIEDDTSKVDEDCILINAVEEESVDVKGDKVLLSKCRNGEESFDFDWDHLSNDRYRLPAEKEDGCGKSGDVPDVRVDDGVDRDDGNLVSLELKKIWRKKNVQVTQSVGKVNIIKKDSFPSASNCIRKPLTGKRFRVSRYPITNRTPRSFISVHDLLEKFKKMQKLLNSKGKTGPGPTASPLMTALPLYKLRRTSSGGNNRGQGEDLKAPIDGFFSSPSQTKISTPGNKSWRINHFNSEVHSLGLDDLLLKASELNAENFTKALGRKLDNVQTGFNANGNSEIVLTIPKSRRNSTEMEFSKKPNTKFRKFDLKKQAIAVGKNLAEEKGGDFKNSTEASSRKIGIKVKSVENINEEFKDSMELKKREGFNEPANGSLEYAEDKKEGSGQSGPVEDSNFRRGEKRKSLPDSDSQNSGDFPCEGKRDESGRPFVMTIVQEKSEKQRPAILRNSIFKRKPNHDKGHDKLKNKDVILRSCEKDKGGDGNESSLIKAFPDGNRHKRLKLETPEDECAAEKKSVSNNVFPLKKKNIPCLLNKNRKNRPCDSEGRSSIKSVSVTGNKKAAILGDVPDKESSNEKVFRVTGAEQKLGPKEISRRFIKVLPYESDTKGGKAGNPQVFPGDSFHSQQQQQQKTFDEDSLEKGSPPKDPKGNHLLSLAAFSSLLREILPDKWFLCLDKKYGLQIIKTHVDEVLNPSILMSVVVAKSGKLTVNVRGRQLEKRHQIFSNLCDMGNSENKLSLNYVLTLLNKLRHSSVCYGCDPTLKKYSPETDKETVDSRKDYRSPLCPLLVSLGKKRCYPCYRMNESLKKRYRREKMEKKTKDAVETEEEGGEKESSRSVSPNEGPESETVPGKSVGAASGRGVKRNLEEFLEESFSTMKQQIEDELERNKASGEKEKALKAQEEVLSFMGLARKDTLDGIKVRKSKRTKAPFYNGGQRQGGTPVKKKVDPKELEFLEKYWADINTLFSTSLLFGAYSRTGRSRLREKCRMFHKLLSTWREIVKANPEWIGGEMVSDLSENSGTDTFDKMDLTALRAYVINSVKEVNRIKHKLRTRNSYFKILYNKFVKRRMKRSKTEEVFSGKISDEREEEKVEKKEVSSSANSSTVSSTPTDLSGDESGREKNKIIGEEEREKEEKVKREKDHKKEEKESEVKEKDKRKKDEPENEEESKKREEEPEKEKHKEETEPENEVDQKKEKKAFEKEEKHMKEGKELDKEGIYMKKEDEPEKEEKDKKVEEKPIKEEVYERREKPRREEENSERHKDDTSIAFETNGDMTFYRTRGLADESNGSNNECGEGEPVHGTSPSELNVSGIRPLSDATDVRGDDKAILFVAKDIPACPIAQEDSVVLDVLPAINNSDPDLNEYVISGRSDVAPPCNREAVTVTPNEETLVPIGSS